MTHGSVAKRVREHKEVHPERYCAAPGCLWRYREGGAPCPKHPIKLLLTGPHVDRALTLLALIQGSTNPEELYRYEHNLKTLRLAHPEVAEITDADPRLAEHVRELKAAFEQPAPGFYLRCGLHWTALDPGWTVSADPAHATRFETWEGAHAAKQVIEARPYAGIYEIVEVR
jgi:uncharacterized protein (DUF58 family)